MTKQCIRIRKTQTSDTPTSRTLCHWLNYPGSTEEHFIWAHSDGMESFIRYATNFIVALFVYDIPKLMAGS